MKGPVLRFPNSAPCFFSRRMSNRKKSWHFLMVVVFSHSSLLSAGNKGNLKSYFKPCLETLLLPFYCRAPYGTEKNIFWRRGWEYHIRTKHLQSCRCFLVTPYKYRFCSVSKSQSCWQRKRFSSWTELYSNSHFPAAWCKYLGWDSWKGRQKPHRAAKAREGRLWL